MSERPFMQLYVSDFVGDTLLLSAEHIGVYLLLLIALWNAHGELPKDEVKLARAARMPVENWRTIWADLEQFFEVSETSISHGRLSRELLKAAGKSVSRSEAGRRGGIAKALKDKNTGLAIATPLPRHLPKPYRKNGAIALDPTEGTATHVTIDRSREPETWAECERLMGKKAGTSNNIWAFPTEYVTQARQNLAAKAVA